MLVSAQIHVNAVNCIVINWIYMDSLQYDCRQKAYKLYIDGDEDGAIAVCIAKNCEKYMECQRLSGWIFYNISLYDMAINRFKMAASKGDAESYFGIGSAHYALGEYKMAMDLFYQAAGYGYGRAFHWIGGMYRDGIGVPVNYNKTIYFFDWVRLLITRLCKED
ncbi:hypothetical protein [Ottowia sp.]|uniref:tetratricopeptide repeat protein n=1 Tax=Ottowia sp. TaxID=1898956 RepID=UPI003A8A796F